MHFFELIPDGTHFDFLGRRRICIAISCALIVLGAVWAGVFGVPMGIDFVGGTELQVRFDDAVAVDEARLREVAGQAGFAAEVVRFGEADSKEFLIKYKDEGEAAAAADGLESNTRVIQLEQAFRSEIGAFEEQRVEYVGPKVGEELRADGANALLLSALATLVYIAFRFTSRYAPGAVVAVVHDLAITAGLLVIAGVEFDLRILAAMLAILGYSLNDTIIIYDRIRENLELHTKADLQDVLNLSVNQTLSRTVLTSATTFLAVVALYVLGGEVIRPFAFAMMIGVFVGTYSSIFIASPLLLFLEQRYGGSRGGGGRGTAPRKARPAAQV